jgi:hypothetical protein
VALAFLPQQVQQRRIAELEQQLENALQLGQLQEATTQAAQKRVSELQDEVENNAGLAILFHFSSLLTPDPWAFGLDNFHFLLSRARTCPAPAAVFKLHYDELLAKDEEIAKLRAVIQGLSAGR